MTPNESNDSLGGLFVTYPRTSTLFPLLHLCTHLTSLTTRQVLFFVPRMDPLITHHLNTHPASYYNSLGGHLVTHHLKTPPTSRFDSSGGLFGPTTLSQPHYATPNESNDSLGVFTTLLHSTTPNESI